MCPKIPGSYLRNRGPTPFHIPWSCPSTNQWQPSSSSSTRGTRSRHLTGAWDDQRSGGQYVRSMWLSPEISRSCIGASCPAAVPWLRPPMIRGVGSADPPVSSLRLLQPEVHAHLPIHYGRRRQMLPRPFQVARPACQRSKAEVAVGDDRAHAQLVGECQRFAVVGFGVFLSGRQRDITAEAEGLGLAS